MVLVVMTAAGDFGGDGAVAVEVGGFVVAVGEQGAVGQDEVDGERDGVGVGLAGETFDEDVGFDLAEGALLGVTAVLAQDRHGGLLHRRQRGDAPGVMGTSAVR